MLVRYWTRRSRTYTCDAQQPTLQGLLSPAGIAKYLPLDDAVNSSIEINTYLASATAGVITQSKQDGSANAADWQLENVVYEAQLCEIDASVHAALTDSIGGVYIIPYNSWRQYIWGYLDNKFFLAFDTQSYSAASGAVDDGVQAQHGSTYLQLDFDSGGMSSATQLDIYILFDGILTIANGAISAAF
ncbi:hypothetical protein T492DRAFT_1128428 [Pavlovales sp. CCMP2436]|nr:hypothetical protein T492DRAFT_1128428 [Pavlovales sp. CCMP2436]